LSKPEGPIPMLLKTRTAPKISEARTSRPVERGKAVKKEAWHSVSIIRGRQACATVAELNGRKWLSAEAPQLPIKGCDAKHCECRYRHHADRRSDDRRETDGLVSGPPKHGERRTGQVDRRNKEP
jgi:hypothetical protein